MRLQIGLAVFLTTLLGAATAFADEEVPAVGPVGEMQATIDDHYGSQSTRDIIYTSVALSGIPIGGIRMAVGNDDFSTGVGVGFISASVISGSIGIAQIVASVGDRDAQMARVEADPAGFKSEELERVHGASNGYWALLALDTTMAAGGLAALLVGLSQDQQLVAGAGSAVAFHGGVMLGLDIWRSIKTAQYGGSVEDFEVE